MSCENCNSPRVTNIGVKFLATIKDQDCVAINISTASLKRLYFKAPDDTIKYFSANFESDGSDGKIYYITNSTGDLHVAGSWKIQAYVEIGTAKLYSNIETFMVEDNLL